MNRPVYGSILIGCLTIGLSSGLVQAGTWTDGLFPENRHDFGMVPRGVKVKHDFQLVNRLAEPINILNLRPSCGCTSGRANASVVGPGQTATIEAEMDTRNYVGLKATVLYVSLMTASGREAEVGLGVTSTILSDIVLNPGSIDFGTINRRQTPSQVLTIERINGAGWRFNRMVSASRSINAQLVETKREGAAVTYTLYVSLKGDAPAGRIRDEIHLLSNDAETPSIPVLVTAWIRGELTAAPSILTLGQIHSSAGAQGRFVVRASRPFAIRSIEGTGDGFSVSPPDGKRQSAHIVAVAYRPAEGTTVGDIRRVFRVYTDLPGEAPLELTATLRVEP
jgi:hypothetical protein